MSRSVKVKDYKAMCHHGEEAVDAWAPFPKSPIVVHQKVGVSGCLFGDYILAHRASGMSIRSWQIKYSTKRAALKAARVIAKFPEWSKFGRAKGPKSKIPGWNKKLAAALRKKVDAALPASS